MTDPFAQCDCGQAIPEARPFCGSCWPRLPKTVQQRLDTAVRKGDHAAYRAALTEARRLLR